MWFVFWMRIQILVIDKGKQTLTISAVAVFIASIFGKHDRSPCTDREEYFVKERTEKIVRAKQHRKLSPI